MKNLAIIPARGGSKGLKDKNIFPLNGKPLICYTLEAALGCPFFDRVLLSTDSVEIADKCETYLHEPNFRILFREKSLSDDNTPLSPVIAKVTRQAETNFWETFGIIVTLQPTSPLRTSQHITEACARFGPGVAVVRRH